MGKICIRLNGIRLFEMKPLDHVLFSNGRSCLILDRSSGLPRPRSDAAPVFVVAA